MIRMIKFEFKGIEGLPDNSNYVFKVDRKGEEYITLQKGKQYTMEESRLNYVPADLMHILEQIPPIGGDGEGSQGPMGPAGPKGDKGDTGLTGPQGSKGDVGAAGAQGPKGDKGDKGDTGTQGIKGDTGAAGTPGTKGDTGPQGLKGDKGDKGDPMLTGTSRPASPTKGQMYYDDTLSKPIVYNGTAWVDFTGTTV